MGPFLRKLLELIRNFIQRLFFPPKLPVLLTSDPDFYKKALDLYRKKERFMVEDDAKLGIEKRNLVSYVALIAFACRSHSMSKKEIITLFTGIGISASGVLLIVLAILDPEPTSRLWILLAGGVVLAVTGSLTILKSLGLEAKVEASRSGFVCPSCLANKVLYRAAVSLNQFNGRAAHILNEEKGTNANTRRRSCTNHQESNNRDCYIQQLSATRFEYFGWRFKR